MDCFSKQKGDTPSSKIEKNKWSRFWSTVVAQGRNDSKNRNVDAYSQISWNNYQQKTELRH
jgi:hypothetical protein